MQNEGDIRQQVRGGMGTTERMTQAGVGRRGQANQGTRDPESDSGGGGRPASGARNTVSGGSETNGGGDSRSTG